MNEFHKPYRPSDDYSESELERVGVWMTELMDETKTIRVIPSTDAEDHGKADSKGKSKNDTGKESHQKSEKSPQENHKQKPDFILKKDGTVTRVDSQEETQKKLAKKMCLPEVVISYEGRYPNFEQSLTLRDLASYARITGKDIALTGKPLLPWLNPLNEIGGKGKFQPYQFDVKPGISLLPEGILTLTPIAKALRDAELELGKNIDVTSAIRTPERQAELYNELKSSQAVAPPGISYHQLSYGGNAIDVANFYEAKSVLEKRGFMHGEPGKGTLYNDPWHFTFWGKEK